MTIDTASKFYYGNGSIYSYVATLLLHEKGIENQFEYVPIRLGQDNIAPWYIQLNPNGQVPTLVHNGKAIPDSFNISVYVDKEWPTTPDYSTDDPEVVAVVEKWRDIRVLALIAGRKTAAQDISQAEKNLKGLKDQVLAYAKENPDIDYQTRLANHDARALSLIDHETYLIHKSKTDELLKETDAALENRDTVLPKGRTIADVYTVVFIYWLTKKFGLEFIEEYKNIQRYYQKETAKDSFVRAFKDKW